jgi:CubicO group peptidase (beta-lactamase class C family)/D-alanyl-D-alanine dipeptidase
MMNGAGASAISFSILLFSNLAAGGTPCAVSPRAGDAAQALCATDRIERVKDGLQRSIEFTVAAAATDRPTRVNAPPVSSRGDIAAREDYAAVAQMLEGFIGHEIADKELPALSIALVDDQQIVWAQGFGWADAGGKIPATAETLYRVGSVSKLFTDIAIMQLVEQGALDLDAPVTRYLPDFQPRNPSGQPITLRQLMSHRSGLVREPPLGNYFDPTEPTLAQTIASLNRTTLVYAPGSRTKYSNAAIGVVGYLLERTQDEPFAKYLEHAVLHPIGMRRSSFEPSPAITQSLAHADMWTLDGRRFQAPAFQLGVGPAASLYTNAIDLGRFVSALFSGANGPLLESATLGEMWTPQFPARAEKDNYGIGFEVSHFEGRRQVGHSGAIYGFATTLTTLPAEKLGVVALTAKDGATEVTKRVAEVALKGMLAVQRGDAIVQPELSSPVPPELARRVAGRYVNGPRAVELIESSGKLSLLELGGGKPARLRMLGDALIADDNPGYGGRIELRENAIVIGDDELTRAPAHKPAPAPAKWRGLIGEYGWDHNILYVFEKDAKLWALIDWFEFNPLEQVSDNEFKFPDYGFFEGERLIFTRDARGRATQVNAGDVVFKRRNIGPEEGAQQQLVKPLRPVNALLKEALAATPPKETGKFRESDLVELTALDPTIKLDIRYATTNNFLNTIFYSQPRAFMQRTAAEALVRAHRKLRKLGYGLLIHDAYRPWYVTQVFWDAMPDDKKIFVADPAQGSRHNRGAAVDLTLYDLNTGKPVQMVATYDEPSDRSYPDYPGGTSLQRWHRTLLRERMEAEGFTVYEAEWWHFDYVNWRQYPIVNLPFDQIDAHPPSAHRPP